MYVVGNQIRFPIRRRRRPTQSVLTLNVRFEIEREDGGKRLTDRNAQRITRLAAIIIRPMYVDYMYIVKFVRLENHKFHMSKRHTPARRQLMRKGVYTHIFETSHNVLPCETGRRKPFNAGVLLAGPCPTNVALRYHIYLS